MTKALWQTESKYECKKFCLSNYILLHWFVNHFFPDFTFADNSTNLVGAKCPFSFFCCYSYQETSIYFKLSNRFHFFDRRFFSNAATRFDVILDRAWLLFFKKKISTSRRKPFFVWLGKCCNLLNSYSPTFLLYFSFVIYPISGIQINTYGNNSNIGSLSNFFSAYW